MEPTPTPTRCTWTSWLEGLAGTLTFVGILLYIALSVPASIFYSILDTSPQTAGLTYIGILTGSIVGVSMIIVVGTSFLFWVASFLAYVGFYARLPIIIMKIRRHPFIADQDDQEFEAYVVTQRKYFELVRVAESIGISFDDYKARLARRRVLLRMSSLTSAESSELVQLEQWAKDHSADKIVLSFGVIGLAKRDWRLTRDWLRRHGRNLIIVFVTLVVIGLLPLSAMQASLVEEGHQDFGSKLGLFAYGASPVSISAAIKDHPAAIDYYVHRDLFLLGQNDQQVVLYSPADKQSVTIPVNAVIITSR